MKAIDLRLEILDYGFEPDSDTFTRYEIQRRMNIAEAIMTVDTSTIDDIDYCLDKIPFYFDALRFLGELADFEGIIDGNES